jgi:hypothetical protein
LDELIAELGDLKTLVKSIDPVNRVLAAHNDTVVQQYISIRRRFDYAAFIVALYTSFEKFVEKLITEYVQLEARHVDYATLPPKLTDKHLLKSTELLCRSKLLGEGRYAGINVMGVVRNLFDCLNGAKPYALNVAAVIAHEANMRANEVDAMFGVVGIEKICDRVCSADAMKAWYCDGQGLETPPQDGVKRTVIERRLNDIVERRNQVAHNGDAPTELLGDKAMNDAIAFIESLARSIFGIVTGCYLQAHYGASASCIELTLADRGGPYKDGSVVVVNKPAQRIFVGQPAFIIVESTVARWGRIQGLRLDGADISEVVANTSAPNGIGVGLDFKYPNNAKVTLIALPSDDDAVWSPQESVVTPTISAC